MTKSNQRVRNEFIGDGDHRRNLDLFRAIDWVAHTHEPPVIHTKCSPEYVARGDGMMEDIDLFLLVEKASPSVVEQRKPVRVTMKEFVDISIFRDVFLRMLHNDTPDATDA